MEQIGPSASDTFESLALNGAVVLNAGEAPSITCGDTDSNPTTQLGEGNMNAVLISTSKGVSANAAAAQRSAAS